MRAFRQLKSDEQLTWAASAEKKFPITMFDSVEKWYSPVITDMWIRIVAVLSTSTAPKMRTLYQLIKKLLIQDQGGERIAISGAALRIFNHMEYGAREVDGPDPAASGTPTVTFFVRIPVEYRNAVRSQDFRWNVRGFRKGGEILVTFSGSSLGSGGGAITITSATLDLFARVLDEPRGDGKIEAKTRTLLKEISITKKEESFAVGESNALLRRVAAYVGPTDENAGTAWGAQNVRSDTLLLPDRPDDVTQYDYLSHADDRARDSVGTILSEDPVRLDMVVPFINPRERQPMTELPMASSFHFATDKSTLPTDPTMIINSIVNRKVDTLSAACGPERAPAGDGGMIKKADGFVTPASGVDDCYSRKLPALV